jgi:ribonuclease P protein subunit POP4
LYSGMLIGKQVEVLDSPDKSLISLKGFVADETKNTLVLVMRNDRELRIPKSVVVLSVSNGRNGPFVLEGSKLIGTPAERIKG